MRRILIIAIIFILIGGGLFIYGKYKKPVSHSPTGIGTFFPLGGDTVPDGTSVDGQINTVTQQENSDEVTLSRFKKITNRPIAGFIAYTREVVVQIPQTDPKAKPKTETIVENVVRYVSRINGFVYEIKDGGIPLQVTNIYVPNVYEAVFLENNKKVALRFLREDGKTIATYVVPIPEPNPDGTRTQKEGIFLRDNISSLAIAPNQQFIARLTNESTAGVVTIVNTNNTSPKEILRNPFKEWILSWPKQELVTVQTKASQSVEGFLYSINGQTKKLSRILGNIPGLTTSISPSGTYIIYSQSTENGFVSRLFNTKTNQTKDLGVSILPEKCAWLKNDSAICAGNSVVREATYPDSWYAGTVSFSDDLYRLNTTATTLDTINESASLGLDMTQLQVQEKENMLYFIDKQTGSLWRFSL